MSGLVAIAGSLGGLLAVIRGYQLFLYLLDS